MTLTQLAEKHNLDPVAFRLALQEWIDAQQSHVIRGKFGTSCHVFFDSTELRKGDYIIARPSLLEE